MTPHVLRIIDVNCNRVREALRVLEDYCRLTLGHAGLSAALKQLRHDFQTATDNLQRHALASRDCAGDVGTAITTENESKRESLSAVVTAAGKRLSEALRTIEEYAKVSDSATVKCEIGAGAAGAQRPGGSPRSGAPAPAWTQKVGIESRVIESLRYRFYDLEKQVLATLTPGRAQMAGVRLYVLVTESLCKRPWLETVEAAIVGGADCVQLREKGLEGRELLQRARQLVALCRRHNVISIINDRPDIAIFSGADGVHVGQCDLPATAVRQLLGPDKIVGVSTHHLDHARQAVIDGADYIGVGPIFPSLTKPRDFLPGLTYGASAAAEMPIPCVAISGIALHNVQALKAAGLSAAAVSSAVISADDPEAAARALKAALQ
ncbi:MAG TPA: thiamine phosphate synthase [Tepidisphaeraceae bacterium]